MRAAKMRGRRTFKMTVLTFSGTVASVSPSLEPKSVKISPTET